MDQQRSAVARERAAPFDAWTVPRVRVRTVLAVATLLALLLVTGLVLWGSTAGFDVLVVARAAAARTPALALVMAAVSELGGGGGLALLTAVPLAFALALNASRAALLLASTFVAAGMVNVALKVAVARPRPADLFDADAALPRWEPLIWPIVAVLIAAALWPTRWRRAGLLVPVVLVAGVLVDRMFEIPWHTAQQTWSFPSGHALRTITLAASVLLIAAWRLPRWAVALIGALLLAIGLSRVGLGLHYPTDVLAGWLAGLVVVLGLSLVIDLIRVPAPLAVRREPGAEGHPT